MNGYESASTKYERELFDPFRNEILYLKTQNEWLLEKEVDEYMLNEIFTNQSTR